MQSEWILKKIQKKQRMLLKVLLSGSLDVEENERLDRIADNLRHWGLVDPHSYSITSDGREFAAAYGELLFGDLFVDDEVLIDKLLLRRSSPKGNGPKVLKSERLLLTLFLEGPVRRENIRGGKRMIPHLIDLGFLEGIDVFNLTERGRALLGTPISTADKLEATRRYFTMVRVDAERDLVERAERYLALYRNGFTYQDIGDLHGLTRERVRQILNKTPNFALYLEEHEEAKRRRELEKDRDSKLKKIEKSLANQFPERVDELWDWEKNVGLDPTQISSRSAGVEIWWKCPIDGHSWKKRPSDIAVSWWRSNTSGCPKCAGKTKKPTKQPVLVEVFPDLVHQVWDFENNRAEGLDPTKLTLASNRKAWFKCPIDHHTWAARIHATVRQQWSVGNPGCRVCNGTVNRKQSTWGKAPTVAEEFPKQVEQFWDFEKNKEIGIEPDKITVGSSRNIWLHCPADHSWSAKIAAVGNSWKKGNSGCPTCSGRLRGVYPRLLDAFPSFIAEFWDFDENDAIRMSYEKLTIGSGRVAHFKCNRDGTRWNEPIKDIVRYWSAGVSGCPKCTKGRRTRRKVL